VTEPVGRLHSTFMLGVSSAPAPAADVTFAAPSVDKAGFESVYDTYFPYIWRSVQRLGVPPSLVDDVVQEVFIVVYRRLDNFEARSTLKTWLYAIALRVARVHRERHRRAQGQPVDVEQTRAPDACRPDRATENAEAAAMVQSILDGLSDDQREVFVLAELEELPMPEIARILDVKLNTAYSRLRLARAAFADGTARARARDGWRNP
jgi:RNA polymerase sigma-70 factor (ECF subfamily)